MSQITTPITREEIIAEIDAILSPLLSETGAAPSKSSPLVAVAGKRAGALLGRTLEGWTPSDEVGEFLGLDRPSTMMADMGKAGWKSMIASASATVLPLAVGRALSLHCRDIFRNQPHFERMCELVNAYIPAPGAAAPAPSAEARPTPRRPVEQVRGTVKAGAVPANWLGITETWDAEANLALLRHVETKGIDKDDLAAVRAEWQAMNSEKAV